MNVPYNQQTKSILKLLRDYRSETDSHADQFLKEAAYINFIRLKAFAAVCGFIFLSLFCLDIFYLLSGKWAVSEGYPVLFFSHLSMLMIIAGTIAFTRIMPADHPEKITAAHKRISFTILLGGLFTIVIISFGDVLISGSLAAYLGALFAFAAIFILTNALSCLLFLSSMTLMLVLLVSASELGDVAFRIQIINTVAFAVVALVLSRIIFYYHIRDFNARVLIEKKNDELETRNEELQSAMSKIKILRGLLPICSHCKKIRDDQGYWKQIETYIQEHSEAEFSHGICQECLEKYYKEFDR